MNRLGNITFINKEVNSGLGSRAPREYLDGYRVSIEKYFIPMDTSLWCLENFERFKEERVRRIYEAIKRHFPLAFD